MALEGKPWFPHYASDHLQDAELARCSPEAEGIFWRAVAMSHSGKMYGYLIDSQGRPLTAKDVLEGKAPAIIHGRTSMEKMLRAWKELLDERRIEYSKFHKAYFIPKMVRINQFRSQCSQYGQRGGGSPALKPTVEQQFDRYLNEILMEAEKIPPSHKAEWIAALWDKYKDVPKLGDVHVVTRARQLLKARK